MSIVSGSNAISLIAQYLSIIVKPKTTNSLNLDHFSLSSTSKPTAQLMSLLTAIILLPRMEATFDKPLTKFSDILARFSKFPDFTKLVSTLSEGS